MTIKAHIQKYDLLLYNSIKENATMIQHNGFKTSAILFLCDWLDVMENTFPHKQAQLWAGSDE